MALRRPILGHTVGAMPWPQELAGLRMESLADRLKLLRLHFAVQMQLVGSFAVPLAFDALPFRVIIVLFQVSAGVSGSSRHRADGEHVSTVSAVARFDH